MTCIAGVVANGEVWIGGDGRASFGYYQMPQVQPKVGHVGQMLIGVSGMPRVGQLLFNAREVSSELLLPILQVNASPMDYLCGPFANYLRDLLKSNDAMGTEEGDTVTKTHLLIGLAGRLFMMDGRFAVFESKRGFDACGTGAEVALGYLMASEAWPEPHIPSMRIQGALLAAAEIIPAVGPPFHIEKLVSGGLV